MRIKTNLSFSQAEITDTYNILFKEKGRLRDTDAFYAWVLNKLAPGPSSNLLDVACGEGLFIQAARKKGIRAIGIDISTQGISLAYHRIGDPVLSIANGERLPFEDHCLDFVANIGSLEHFIDPITGVKEMIRVLKPNGKAAIVLPNSFYLVDIVWQVWRTGYSASHRQPLERFATFREWWDFLENGGFQVINAHKYNLCFPRSKADYQWYMQHPRKVLNLLIAPLIPFNFSNHFLFICVPKPSNT